MAKGVGTIFSDPEGQFTPIDSSGKEMGSKDNPVAVEVSGSLVAKETNKVVTAATNILASDYTATKNGSMQLMVQTDTAGVLSLIVDGVSGKMNAGASLATGVLYAFEIPMTAESTYNLQLSVGATMQIKWVVK
jgi:hypothetical protein